MRTTPRRPWKTRRQLGAELRVAQDAGEKLARHLESERSSTARLRAVIDDQEARLDRSEDETKRLLRGIGRAIDTFGRQASAETADVEELRAAILSTMDNFEQALGAVEQSELIGRIGEIADPETHHVIATLHHPDAAEDSVVEVVKRGIRYRGELLHPASVIIVER